MMELEDLAALASSRQSDRKFDTTRTIPMELIERIMDVARSAPSANNSQPYSFVIVTDEKQRKSVAEACSTKLLGINSFVKQAPVQIIVVEEKPNLTTRIGGKLKDQPYTHYDVGIAVAHITLAAEAAGVGSCIVGWFDGEKIQSILNIPSDKRVALTILLGYSLDKKRNKKRKKLGDLIHQNGW